MRGAADGPPPLYRDGPVFPDGRMGHDEHWWQETYAGLEKERASLRAELQNVEGEVRTLADEARALREELSEEQERRNASVSELAERSRFLEQENERLNERVAQAEGHGSRASDAALKREVVAKTKELEKAIREFQQNQQEVLFARIEGITRSMNSLSARAEMPAQIAAPGVALDASATRAAASGTDEAADRETQQALKRRLQSLGDVVVYSSSKYEACSASGRPIPPGTLRVRPRRCDHVFLVECLMPYWAEGVCPVCRCSFALDHRSQEALPGSGGGSGGAGADDYDRYSSVSASASQVGSLAVPRLPHQRSRGALSDGSNLRGPQRRTSRGRSPSGAAALAGRGHRSASRGSRSDTIGGGACRGASPQPLPRDRLSVSPRSVASARSRASSAQDPDRESGPLQRGGRAGRPL